MILDFTNLSSEYTKRLNEIAEEIKVDYTLFVDEYCRKYNNYLFWATPFASRNTYNDDTYLYVSRLLLAKEITEKNKSIDRIVVETRGEYLTLQSQLGSDVSITYYPKGLVGRSIRKKIESLLGFASYFRRHMAYIRYADKEEYVYPEDISIVIGPAICKDFDGYCFVDRYFTGIFDYHEGLYFPYIVNTMNIPNKTVFDKIKNCNNYKFLYDRFLVCIWDIIEIIRYWKYVNRVKKGKYLFKDIDISNIVRQSLECGKSNNTSFDGLMMRKMIGRLSSRGIIVKDFIQWYEGRPFDLLTASAIRKYYPEANYVGYEGYPLTESIPGLYISSYQYESKYSPKIMAIPSKEYEPDAHQFCKEMPLMYIPILRDEYTLREKRIIEDHKYTILVLLSYIYEASVELLKGVVDYSKKAGNICVLIKNHPTNDGYTLDDYGIKDQLAVQYVKGKLADCLDGVDVVVTSLTSSTLEVVFANIPLVVLYPQGKLGHTCLPKKWREKLCCIAYDSRELSEKLELTMYNGILDNSGLKEMLIPKTEANVSLLFS